MAYEHVLTFEDFMNAQKLYFRSRLSRRISLYFFAYVVPAFLILMVGVQLWGMKLRGEGVSLARVLAIVWPLAYIPFVYFFRLWDYRRAFRSLLPPGMQEVPVVFSFDEEGIRSAVTGRSEGHFFWNAILDSEEDERVALLFVRKKLFLFIPKRAMPEDEWVRFRTLVKANVKKS